MPNHEATPATRADVAEIHERIDHLVDVVGQIKTCVAVNSNNQKWVMKLGGAAATITTVAAAFGGWWAKAGLPG